MTIEKIMAKKMYRPMAMYDLIAMAHVETDDGEEETVVYFTDGADETFAVYNEYLDSLENEEQKSAFEGADEAMKSPYGPVFESLKKAVALIDD